MKKEVESIVDMDRMMLFSLCINEIKKMQNSDFFLFFFFFFFKVKRFSSKAVDPIYDFEMNIGTTELVK